MTDFLGRLPELGFEPNKNYGSEQLLLNCINTDNILGINNKLQNNFGSYNSSSSYRACYKTRS